MVYWFGYSLEIASRLTWLDTWLDNWSQVLNSLKDGDFHLFGSMWSDLQGDGRPIIVDVSIHYVTLPFLLVSIFTVSHRYIHTRLNLKQAQNELTQTNTQFCHGRRLVFYCRLRMPPENASYRILDTYNYKHIMWLHVKPALFLFQPVLRPCTGFVPFLWN